MKFGVLTFSYRHSQSFRSSFERTGGYSVNLGDYMQTLAIRRLFADCGILERDIIPVDRDSLSDYIGEQIILPMNACFYSWCFPLSPHIVPMFVGFQAAEEVIAEHADHLRRFQPIGCRDFHTARSCEKHRISAYVTGCATLTFPQREQPPRAPKTLLAYGSGAGDFPVEALESAPRQVLASMEFVFQRKLMHRFPMGDKEMGEAETHARSLLKDYVDRATLVVTPLLHVAAPSMASGIPVILLRKKHSHRFGHLRTLVDIRTAPNFGSIDWSPAAVDLQEFKQSWKSRAQRLLKELSGG